MPGIIYPVYEFRKYNLKNKNLKKYMSSIDLLKVLSKYWFLACIEKLLKPLKLVEFLHLAARSCMAMKDFLVTEIVFSLHQDTCITIQMFYKPHIIKLYHHNISPVKVKETDSMQFQI